MFTGNIVIIGVGGQGTLLASRVLGNWGLAAGLAVKVSEVHGMSQRGGSVVTYVKMGKEVNSPVIDEGTADLVIAFETLEALRALPYLKEGGVLVYNTQRILPMPVITGKAEYPKDAALLLAEKPIKAVAVDALPLAQKAGSEKAVNTVMLGAACHLLSADAALWKEIILENVPAKTKEVNARAFALGLGEDLHVE